MITRNQFDVLYALSKNAQRTQRDLSNACDLSLGTVSSTINSLKEMGFIDPLNQPTDEGLKALKPYKVDNAVIMAAGFASRCAPLSYERPKGLFRVKGEVLIERQIEQLRNAGIKEIYIVVGYMKELFFYLEDAFDVKIIINDEYYRRNNTSSLFAARYYLRNSYICSSDNYFIENPFTDHVYDSYFACEYSEGHTNEWCARTGPHGRIIKYGPGGSESWFQVGEFYWTKAFSRKFMDLLEEEYDDPAVADMLLDAFYARHIDELDACIKKYESGSILEFDTINEIKLFDDKFVENMDSQIISNICEALQCTEEDISGFEQIKRGNTNIIFSFDCRDERFVYRHPGKDSEQIIDRLDETCAQEKADELGIDGTTIAIDAEAGWKISRWVKDCYDFEYGNEEDALRAFRLMHRLHAAKISCEHEFNIMSNCAKFRSLAARNGHRGGFNTDDLGKAVERLDHFVAADGVEKVLCHNDCCDTNIIVSPNEARIIDWEYAGFADPAYDVASFIVGGEHTKQQVDRLLELYFERPLTKDELRHMYGCIALCSYHWLMWGIYRQSVGHDAGSLLYYWYRYAVEYSKLALGMYSSKEPLRIP